MAANPPQLIVVYARQVRRELGEIWDWNAKEYGAAHASDYVRYIEQRIEGLGAKYGDGKPMSKRPHLMEITFRRSRKPKANAHIAIYRVNQAARTVTVLHIFHTSQDIEGRLGREGL